MSLALVQLRGERTRAWTDNMRQQMGTSEGAHIYAHTQTGTCNQELTHAHICTHMHTTAATYKNSRHVRQYASKAKRARVSAADARRRKVRKGSTPVRAMLEFRISNSQMWAKTTCDAHGDSSG